MKRIKIIGLTIIILLIALVLLLNTISNENIRNINFIKKINRQKATTQDISKEIFYIYKHRVISTNKLDSSIKSFSQNIDTILEKQEAEHLIKLLNRFNYKTREFKREIQTLTPYSNIILEKIVRDIYNQNIELIIEFDRLLERNQRHNSITSNFYKKIEYILLATIFILLLYLSFYILKIDSSLDRLIDRIDRSIRDIEKIDSEAEDILISANLKNEDLIIEALEELMSSKIKLKQLKRDLESLKNIENRDILP